MVLLNPRMVTFSICSSVLSRYNNDKQYMAQCQCIPRKSLVRRWDQSVSDLEEGTCTKEVNLRLIAASEEVLRQSWESLSECTAVASYAKILSCVH